MSSLIPGYGTRPTAGKADFRNWTSGNKMGSDKMRSCLHCPLFGFHLKITSHIGTSGESASVHDSPEGMSDYVFGEVEKFIVYDMKTNEITAKYRNSFVPSFRKEYVWFLRDGFFVRSPTLVDGVSVAPASNRR